MAPNVSDEEHAAEKYINNSATAPPMEEPQRNNKLSGWSYHRRAVFSEYEYQGKPTIVPGMSKEKAYAALRYCEWKVREGDNYVPAASDQLEVYRILPQGFPKGWKEELMSREFISLVIWRYFPQFVLTKREYMSTLRTPKISKVAGLTKQMQEARTASLQLRTICNRIAPWHYFLLSVGFEEAESMFLEKTREIVLPEWVDYDDKSLIHQGFYDSETGLRNRCTILLKLMYSRLIDWFKESGMNKAEIHKEFNRAGVPEELWIRYLSRSKRIVKNDSDHAGTVEAADQADTVEYSEEVQHVAEEYEVPEPIYETVD